MKEPLGVFDDWNRNRPEPTHSRSELRVVPLGVGSSSDDWGRAPFSNGATMATHPALITALVVETSPWSANYAGRIE